MASAIESSDSGQAALELLKPDPPLEADKNEEAEEDLEALRMAALMSIKPKKSAYKVQAHPVRSNLLSIVPVEPEQSKGPEDPKAAQPVISRSDRGQDERGNSKFDRVRDRSHSPSESESEYEEIEVEEEVTASESENETSKKENEAGEENGNGKASVKKQMSTEPNDILSIDCTDEVDEFTNFLNEFEDELKDKPKQKKTKKIMVKKRVKKEKMSRRGPPRMRSRSRSTSPRFSRGPGGKPRSRSRSPRGHRRRLSPRRRYTPPRRSRSPYRYRRSSRSPPPPRRSRSPYGQRRSPSPYRRRSPRSPRRFSRSRSRSPKYYNRHHRTPTLSPEPARAGSAPRAVDHRQTRSRSTDKQDLSKSKSLPPSQHEKQKGNKKSKEVKSEEEKLKRLPSPEREKLLQRKKKFETNVPVKATAKKIISLKRNESPDESNKKSKDNVKNSDAVDDTLDLFEEEKPNKRAAANIKGPQVTDLRVQLHKKRRLQKPRIEVHDDDISEDEDDKDSLENAHISDVDEDDDPVPMVRQRKIQVSNRIVQKTGSPRKVNIEPEKSKIRSSLMSRLGARVSDNDSEEESNPKATLLKRKNTDSSDQDDQRKKKKKEKKAKKAKKKEKKKSKKASKSSSDEETSTKKGPTDAPLDDDDEELYNWFEDIDSKLQPAVQAASEVESEDVLLDKMKKKNEALMKRHQQVQEDRKLYS